MPALTAARALALYRLLFAGYIVVSSARTLLQAGGVHSGHIVGVLILLASIEIAAALVFPYRRTRRAAGTALLLVFTAGFALGLALGEVPLQLVLYAGTVLLLLTLERDEAVNAMR